MTQQRKHSGFIASEGVNGWYQLQLDDEIIEMQYPISSLMIETGDTELGIKINDLKDIWYVASDRTEVIENLIIKKIQVLNPLGTLIRWKGLI